MTHGPLTAYSFKKQRVIAIKSRADLDALLEERRARGMNEDTLAVIQRHFETILSKSGVPP